MRTIFAAILAVTLIACDEAPVSVECSSLITNASACEVRFCEVPGTPGTEGISLADADGETWIPCEAGSCADAIGTAAELCTL